MRRVSRTLFPSFPPRPTAINPTTKIRPTAYLDGIRGVAALLVVLHHYSCQYTPSLLNGYGATEQDRYLLQLPIIGVLHNGAFMVNLFYILSGCVLSKRCFKLAREGKRELFTSSLVSSVFRRWIRLFLPVMVTMILAAIISRTQLWDREIAKDSVAVWNSTYYTGPTAPECTRMRPEENIAGGPASADVVKVLDTRDEKERPRWVSAWKMQPKMDSLTDQLRHLQETMEIVVDPFNMGGKEDAVTEILSPYNPGDVMWTIPLEWTGSMLVFMLTLIVAWIAKSHMRLLVLSALVIWCIRTLRWYQARFISGMIISELMLNLEEQQQPAISLTNDIEKSQLESDRTTEIKSPHFIGWLMVFLVSLHFGSLPHNDPAQAFGFKTLLAYNPKWYGAGASHIFLGLGSFLFMLSVTYSPVLRSIFNTRLAHYLGKISFALYLIHVMVLWTAGTRIIGVCIDIFGKEGIPYLIGVISGGSIVLALTISLADLFTTYVDEKCVALAKWVGDAMLVRFH